MEIKSAPTADSEEEGQGPPPNPPPTRDGKGAILGRRIEDFGAFCRFGRFGRWMVGLSAGR